MICTKVKYLHSELSWRVSADFQFVFVMMIVFVVNVILIIIGGVNTFIGADSRAVVGLQIVRGVTGVVFIIYIKLISSGNILIVNHLLCLQDVV